MLSYFFICIQNAWGGGGWGGGVAYTSPVPMQICFSLVAAQAELYVIKKYSIEEVVTV